MNRKHHASRSLTVKMPVRSLFNNVINNSQFELHSLGVFVVLVQNYITLSKDDREIKPLNRSYNCYTYCVFENGGSARRK